MPYGILSTRRIAESAYQGRLYARHIGREKRQPPCVLCPNPMRTIGQVQCKWAVRWSAITHPRGQQCGVGPIWKCSIRAHIQPPSKTGATGVTRVTPFTKRRVSLAFMPVTQLDDIAYPRCNAAPACNAKVSILQGPHHRTQAKSMTHPLR